MSARVYLEAFLRGKHGNKETLAEGREESEQGGGGGCEKFYLEGNQHLRICVCCRYLSRTPAVTTSPGPAVVPQVLEVCAVRTHEPFHAGAVPLPQEKRLPNFAGAGTRGGCAAPP